MTIRPELLNALLKDYAKPEDWVGEGGLLKQLPPALVKPCLETELSVPLDQPPSKSEGKAKQNRRNGHSQTPIKGEFGPTAIGLPPERNGEVCPSLLKPGQTRFDGFDSQMLSLYARGLTPRDIQAQL